MLTFESADHLNGCHIQGSEQRGRSVPFVVSQGQWRSGQTTALRPEIVCFIRGVR